MKKIAGVIGYVVMLVFLGLALLLALGVIGLALPGAGGAHLVFGKGGGADVVRGLPDAAPVVAMDTPAVMVVETAVPVMVVATATVMPVPFLVDVGVDVTREFWASCALKQSRGQRVSPKCPANAGELLGVGR